MQSIEPVAIGAKNVRLARLRRLIGRAKVRNEEQAFVVDGPVLVAEALRSDLTVQQVFGSRELLSDDLLQAIGPGVDVFEVDESVLCALLDPVNPRPLAAVVAKPDWSLDAMALDQLLVVAVELRDPGNMGSLIRSVEGSGAAGLVIVGDSVDQHSPKVVRASAGSIFRVPVVSVSATAEAADLIRAQGRAVLSAVVDPEAEHYDRFDLAGAAVLVGNEPHGLSVEAIKLSDAEFTIPLSPTVESLNVAAAGAILCFEAARQHRAARSGPKFIGRETLDTSGCNQ